MDACERCYELWCRRYALAWLVVDWGRCWPAGSDRLWPACDGVVTTVVLFCGAVVRLILRLLADLVRL